MLAIVAIGYMLFLASIVYFRYTLNETVIHFKDYADTLYEHPFSVHSNALKLKLIVYKIRDENLTALVDTNNKVDFGFETQTDFAAIDSLLQEITTQFLGDKQKVEEFRIALGQWKNNVTVVRNLIRSKHKIESLNYLNDKVTPSFQALDNKLTYILNFAQLKAKTIVSNANLEADSFDNSLSYSLLFLIALDFPRFSRQLIMSEITKRKLNERHQIYRRV